MQLLAVTAIIGLALLYFARSTWRTWTGKKTGCASGCGKCATVPPAVPEQRGRFPLPQV